MSHARKSDPVSSHLAVGAIGKDWSLRDLVVRAARELEAEGIEVWSDSELWLWVERLSGRRQQRNVVARARGLVERDGLFERVGLTSTGKQLLFQISGDFAASLPPPVIAS